MGAHRVIAKGSFDAVFFDLDGTLVDTAPDMVSVLFSLMDRHRAAPIDFELARNNVSNGAAGLIRTGFPGIDDDELQDLLSEFLDAYTQNLCRSSVIFDPLRELLAAIRDAERKWGVVTNKPEYLTVPLLRQLGIDSEASCIVSGDTLNRRKPHPAPMLHAAQLANVDPERTVYVGDAQRDIEAGAAAGMATVAVGYGYIVSGDDPMSWGADAFAADTMALNLLVRQALNLES